jgi:DNA-directed RNA polymerase beta' subunit
MVNRYPSIREESFTALRCKVEDVKAIKFSLSVIKKMNADFDGDEM